MMWWYDGMGWGGWTLMILTMIAFWSLVVFGVLAIFRGDRGTRVEQRPVVRHPQQILDERFARGEIEVDEYHARQAALHSAH